MNPYVRLADYINDSFQLDLRPHKEEDPFVKIFGLLLEQEEAEIICQLSKDLEDIKSLSLRIGLDEAYLEKKLNAIADKGIIYRQDQCFKLMPFIPGIFEAVGAILETSLIADLLQENIEEIRTLKKKNHNQYRVLPVNVDVSLQITSSSTDEILAYMDTTDQFALQDCICRKINLARNKHCGHSIQDMCMIIGDYAKYFIDIHTARKATKEELIEVLHRADQEGLYHEIYPIEKGKSLFVCNCCTCGCKFMGLADRISSVISFKNKINIDLEACNLCGSCVKECPENVFSIRNHRLMVENQRCFDCGLCSLICQKNAIRIDNLC